MAAYSYQPHHFLLSSTLLPNTPFDISGFVNEGNITSKNSTVAFANNLASAEFLPTEVFHEGFSDAAGVYQSSCHDHSSKMHSAASSVDMEKVEEMGEQVTQKLTPCSGHEEKKTRKGSSLDSKRGKLEGGKAKKQKKSDNGKNVKEKKPKVDKKNQKQEGSEDAQKDYIHVRARRGQATDSHSLAERVRRERISERMKMLQALVPGCEKVTGKALILDEIINYVQSLQNQIEFLSMKLASFNPIYSNFVMDLDAALLRQETLTRLAASQPSGSSQQCSPTAVNYNSSTTTFTTPTVGYHPLIEASLFLQQIMIGKMLFSGSCRELDHMGSIGYPNPKLDEPIWRPGQCHMFISIIKDKIIIKWTRPMFQDISDWDDVHMNPDLVNGGRDANACRLTNTPTTTTHVTEILIDLFISSNASSSVTMVVVAAESGVVSSETCHV